MRKKIIPFIIIFCIAFMPCYVDAKESLGTCNYDLDVNELYMQNVISELRLTVTIYDDGSTGNRKFVGKDSFGNEINVTPKSGAVLDGYGTRLSYSKMFDKNGKFYQAYQERKNCPTIQFIYNNPVLEFHLGGGANVPNNAGSQVLTPNITGGSSSSTSSPKITYCTKRSELDFGNVPITFTATEQNGIKEYTIEMNGTSNTTNYDEVNRIGDYIFSIREEDYDTYWSNQCADVGFYIAGDPSYGEVMTIQTVRPEDGNNAALDYDKQQDWEELGDNLNRDDFDNPVNCPDIINMEEGHFGWILNTILNYIKIIGPILVVLLSAIDFIKAVVGFDEKAMKNAQNKLIIRLVAALGLFLVPTLVQLLLSFINATTCTLR